MRTVGLCTSSRSERGLMEALNKEIKNSELYDIKLGTYSLKEYDIVIIPADRSEMTIFALECFLGNIPFCHYLAGSITHSYCHDDINRWIISAMANFCFAESPQARDNLILFGVTPDRVIVTGTSHFDGISKEDIENAEVPYSPRPFDLILLNPEMQESHNTFDRPEKYAVNEHYIIVGRNEDVKTITDFKRWPRLEFLWLITHCDHFITNSSTLTHELPTLNKWYNKEIKVINPSQRNSERTQIDPQYCKGASKKIADWCEKVDLDWLKESKRFPHRSSETKPFPSGF